MDESVQSILGRDGAIARRLPEYEERREQLELADAVERALSERRHLLAEAGTGVGKSFAYLLPAVLHACNHRGAGPVVVSTRTIGLQQQLEQKDLPFLQSVLPIEWSSVTAVGRNNYLCLRRMNLAHTERGLLFPDKTREAQLLDVVEWSLTTREGTRMDLRTPVDPAVWEEVQAEHGNCLHRACPHYEPCHYQRSRRRMHGAQILVVNHALYMADVALRMAGTAYLPAHEVVVFDEAHHLERIATENLGLRIAESTVLWHLRRLHPRNADRSLLLRYGSPRAGYLWHEVRDAAAGFFAGLADRLGGTDVRSLQDVELDGSFAAMLGDLGLELESNAAEIQDVNRRMEMQARADGILGLERVLRQLCAPSNESFVRWIERERRGPSLRSAPLEVAPALREYVFGQGRTAVLVSATLAPGGDRDFGWLRSRLGIDDGDALQLGSPFDYRNAVQVTIEEALPDPGREPDAFLTEAKARVREHVLANGGRALVLCTSWKVVREIADFLRPSLEQEGIRLLIQGEESLARLLIAKQSEPTSVLIGTDSLWEGIDLPGEALTLLVVMRFPFQRPDHPLTRARMRAIEQRGGNSFADYSLPEAVLKFRQGFGRLVRSGTDHGKVVVLDPRARTKPYGRIFLDALPEGSLDD